jgi:cephalosporin hydroxylase
VINFELINEMSADKALCAESKEYFNKLCKYRYSYNFEWLGRPIIQFPQDMIAVQELIWEVRPDLIIETGIAHGGSLIFSASMLALLDMMEAIEKGEKIDPQESSRKVIGIDIDIREPNLRAIKAHPMSTRIQMIEGSSIESSVVSKVHLEAKKYNNILVMLDSNHTYDHVLSELNAYAQLVSINSYCIVFDTVVEDMPKAMFPDRPWGPGNSPKTAVMEYLQANKNFEIDESIQNKLLLTVAPSGYLKKTK